MNDIFVNVDYLELLRATAKQLDRAVELLRMTIENEDRDPINGCSMQDYEKWLLKTRAFLRELEVE